MPADITRGGMYAVIPAAVLYDPGLRPAAKLLYGEITRLAQASGYCFASNSHFIKIWTFNDKTVSERTIQNLLAELKQRGHIHIQMIRRHGSSGDVIERRIFVGQALAPTPEEPQESAQEPPEEQPEDAPDKSAVGGAENFTTSRRNLHQGGAENCAPFKCIKNTRDKNTPIAPDDVLKILVPYVGKDPDLWDALCGFLEVRKKKKKPLDTARAATLLINRINKLSDGCRETKIALLDNATEHKWDTVYPMKSDELPNPVRSQVVEENGVRYI